MVASQCSLLAAVLLAAVHLQAVNGTVSLNDLTTWQQGAFLRPHPKGCPQGWLWVSAQQWWQIEQQADIPLVINSSIAKDSGHIHNEFCWPQGLPVAGKFNQLMLLLENSFIHQVLQPEDCSVHVYHVSLAS